MTSECFMRRARKIYFPLSHFQICDDSVDPSVFIDSAYIGVAILLSFIILSLIIKPLGRRPIFGLAKIFIFFFAFLF